MNKVYIILIIVLVLFIIIITIIYKNRKVVKVGILLTTSGGPMAENEKKLYDIICEYIKIYNMNQIYIYIDKVEFNPESSTDKYIKGAEYLCKEDVVVIFGCWRSIDRKAILPIIEKYNNILLYPLQYEGNECSKNIMYFGACPNQQINIGIEYGIKNISKNIILIGSDYVFPKTANKIMKEYIKNMDAVLIDEIYISMTETSFDNIIDKILKYYNGTPILIMNTINGSSNKYFFEKLYKKSKKKIISEIFPVMSFSLSEDEIITYNTEWIYGNYFVWNYSQTDILYKSFSNKLIKTFIKSNNIIGDPQYHIFISFLYFINFLNKYNGLYDSKSIRANFMNDYNIPLLTPTGYLKLNENNHLEQPVYILKTNYDKRFNTIYVTPINIKPNPWLNIFEKSYYGCNNKYFTGSKFKTVHKYY